MAHYAEVTEGEVRSVVVVSNDITTIDGVENEQSGITFLNGLFPDSGAWVQTSYWGSIRNKFSAIGDTYDEVLDAFVPSPPYPSWVTLNTSVSPFQWEAPVEQPDGDHLWDEATTSWVEITE